MAPAGPIMDPGHREEGMLTEPTATIIRKPNPGHAGITTSEAGCAAPLPEAVPATEDPDLAPVEAASVSKMIP